MNEQHEGEHAAHEYVGDVTVVVGDAQVAATASLRGHFQPIDGRFHWYGRLAASAEIAALGAGATIVLRTAHGSAEGRLSDLDPWGRMRVTGTGHPPY